MADPAMRFQLNLKDTSLVQALDDFFREAGRAYQIDAELPEEISVRADALKFREALALLLPGGYGAAEDERGVYHIVRSG